MPFSRPSCQSPKAEESTVEKSNIIDGFDTHESNTFITAVAHGEIKISSDPRSLVVSPCHSTKTSNSQTWNSTMTPKQDKSSWIKSISRDSQLQPILSSSAFGDEKLEIKITPKPPVEKAHRLVSGGRV